ncbi:xanthine dehydrogenase family protein molybdopterin-binding subunit [Actibacterium pelagium]|uniref:Carbon monoxide dehydrogenase n=1 Tax=Actibacterium pelagium TaxID=2029103 RepID=A0A917EMA3_9RHOB|nr:xanthine dehydrogenase family protein molybdopterin-binding subunit [Actibacterium pelagium]GGE59956.1 carbon monoxide dehydrogenase [Actibacterium pelagium]
MTEFGKAQGVNRVEDDRFLRGKGRYVDDIAPEGAGFAVFLRSPVAHAVISELNVDDARQAPGVQLVLTAEDMQREGMRPRMNATVAPCEDGSKGAAPTRPILATGKVRFVGEPVAMVVADTREAALDAIEMIVFEFDDLPAKVDLGAGGETIHEEAPDNLAFNYGLGDEAATDAALANADHVVKLRLYDNRVVSNPMEPRGCYAEMAEGRLHVGYNGQGVWGLKSELAKVLGMEAEDIRVTTPDVGGGFGTKGMSYPEYFAVGQAARLLNAPVRWMADRSETMLTDNAGRDLYSDAVIGFDKDLKVVAYRVDVASNLGAYNSGFAQMIQSYLFSRVLTGAYDIQTAYLNTKGYFTNTTQVDAYRGAGRPEAMFTLETLMHHAARQLGVDVTELRRRNFIAPDKFPYKTISGEVYDVGEFARVQDRALALADVGGFAARKAESTAKGKLRGLGTAFYVESVLGDPNETAKVEFADDGMVNLYVGTQSNGQGHETAYTQFLSSQSGIPKDRIRIVQGDSDLIAKGGGTGGSRSVTVQNTAILATVKEMIATLTPFVAGQLGVDEALVTFEDGQFRSESSNKSPTLMEVAEMARDDDRAELLVHEVSTRLAGRSFPNGGHICEVEVDPETGSVEVASYAVADDFGNLMNKALVEGQVHGGVVQGIGQMLTEHVVYDEDGQLLSGTFMDYALPRASDAPIFKFVTEPVPGSGNPLGMKGCGEAGTVGAMGAVANAVQDALGGDRFLDPPYTPHRVWQYLQEERREAS